MIISDDNLLTVQTTIEREKGLINGGTSSNKAEQGEHI